jgi:hypothetical protein
MQHATTATFAEPSRGLCVKDFVISFKGSSIYGMRRAFHPALLITGARAGNIFRKSRLARIARA